MSQKKILLLVEGEKEEPKLLSHFYNLYGVHNVHIVSYKTNLYAFYQRLKKEYADPSGNIEYEFIDLPLFLNSYFNLQGDDKLSKSDFQDILLIFDYDPQDPLYASNKLIELVTNFADSTDLGKLYINYPMLESYKDIDNLESDDFLSSVLHFQELHKIGSHKQNPYKRLVASRTCISKIENISKEEGNKIIKLHSNKLNALIQSNTSSMNTKYIELCIAQCDRLVTDNQIWVINTSLIHFLDEYGEIRHD
ncbi:hypothetical protein A7K91_06805 [Paenibacillus oryzae]|uniref:Uncharacterized protein n=1 Tax=Paenibacillus oryzae TaxID=1844972 RepID=A0A1A5YDE5_9BACL|nr:hypothetical protein [Paenibacillus oryzae]OBR63646.1 hypothetical protein A7K91_06805 [Paenibacillus oryzae]